MLFYVKQMINF